MVQWGKSYKSFILKILVLILVLAAQWQSLPAQEPPFTLGQILIALETKFPGWTTARQEKYIIQKARERGIDFLITSDIEIEIKKALEKFGYSEELLTVLKALAEANKAKAVAAHMRSAESFMEKRQFDEALVQYDKALKLDPQNPVIYVFRGGAYQGKGKVELALADFSKAIELKPNANFYLLRGRSYAVNGNDEKAIADFSKAIELDKNEAAAFSSRGGLFLKKKLYDPAIEDYTKAANLSPNDEKARRELQFAIDEKKKAADAAAAAAKITAGNGTSTQPQTNAGKTTNAVNNNQSAQSQPPLPETRELKILSAPTPVYTEKAFKNKVSGTVRLRITFLASGEIGAVTPVTQLPDGLTDEAIKAARKIKFEPAVQKGVAQTVVKDLNYNFKPQ